MKPKNKCIDCGKELNNRRSMRCMSCENKRRHRLGILNIKGKNNPMYGVHKLGKNATRYIDGRTLKKYYCIDCGKELSEYRHKRCGSCSHKGKNNPFYGKKRLKHSKAISGRNNGMFGKLANYGKGCYYKNIWLRSSYEIAYAKYLDKNKIKWQYESKTFDLGNCTYTPDFYLPKTKEYIEIKGWWRKEAKKKFKKFKKVYPKIKIKVLMFKELKDRNIL
jgi:hypothetical protein